MLVWMKKLLWGFQTRGAILKMFFFLVDNLCINFLLVLLLVRRNSKKLIHTKVNTVFLIITCIRNYEKDVILVGQNPLTKQILAKTNQNDIPKKEFTVIFVKPRRGLLTNCLVLILSCTKMPHRKVGVFILRFTLESRSSLRKQNS